MIGILLAAGYSRRFGLADKLLQPLQDGRSMALTAAQNLISAIPCSMAVIREGNSALQQQLQSIGLHIVECQSQQQNMADSIAAAMQHYAQLTSAIEPARGFVIALGDMPYIRPQTISKVAAAVADGAAIVVPSYQSEIKLEDNGHQTLRRGHPVGFALKFAAELAELQGDQGAKSILQSHADEVTLLPCDDPGILLDIDTMLDIETMQDVFNTHLPGKRGD